MARLARNILWCFALIAMCGLANPANAGDKENQIIFYAVFSHVHEMVSRCGYNFSNEKDLFILATAKTGIRGMLIKSFSVPETDLSNFDRVWTPWAALQSCNREKRAVRRFINMLRTQYKELYSFYFSARA